MMYMLDTTVKCETCKADYFIKDYMCTGYPINGNAGFTENCEKYEY